MTLHLKDDALEYSDEDKIKNLVKKYSEFINYPISLYTSRNEEFEVPIDADEPESEVHVEHMEEQDVEITTGDEEGEVQDGPTTKKVKK